MGRHHEPQGLARLQGRAGFPNDALYCGRGEYCTAPGICRRRTDDYECRFYSLDLDLPALIGSMPELESDSEVPCNKEDNENDYKDSNDGGACGSGGDVQDDAASGMTKPHLVAWLGSMACLLLFV